MIDKITISGNINQIINIDLSEVQTKNEIQIHLKDTCRYCFGRGYLKQYETVARFNGDPFSQTSETKTKCPYCFNN